MFWARQKTSPKVSWKEVTPVPSEASEASDAEDDPTSSIAGDSVATSSGAETDEVLAPKIRVQGVPNCRRGESSWRNEEPEVGNFGLFVGNWGLRGTLADNRQKQLRRDTHDRQILKSPAQVIVLCEATAAVEDLLKRPAVPGAIGAKGLEGRNTFEHWVVRGQEPQAAVLIAARKDNTSFLQLLDYDVNEDHAYREQKKDKMARSRILTCRVGFKQNIGHLGKEIVVCGVHGHCKTMKFEWPAVLNAFLDRLAQKIRHYGIQFLAGDFNMFLTQVPVKLRDRGIECHCLAWYPWRHATAKVHDQALGLDSCGIFYIGGNVQVGPCWRFEHIDVLTAVAGDMDQKCQERQCKPLDVYEGQNLPGQHWAAYRSTSLTEGEAQKNLKARLEDLLWPSSDSAQADLDRIPARQGANYCPYLRFRQKALDKEEWLVGETMHAGAHFPLCVFTKNASSRSNEARERRASRPGWKGRDKGVAAVAEDSKGKGKRGAAVAEDSKGREKGVPPWRKTEKGEGQWDAAVAACPAYPDSGTRRRWGHFDNTWSWK
jgi:hypothetical protein